MRLHQKDANLNRKVNAHFVAAHSAMALGKLVHGQCHRGFGGGFGLGVPVVSYAPRPMLVATASLVIMELVALYREEKSQSATWTRLEYIYSHESHRMT